MGNLGEPGFVRAGPASRPWAGGRHAVVVSETKKLPPRQRAERVSLAVDGAADAKRGVQPLRGDAWNGQHGPGDDGHADDDVHRRIGGRGGGHGKRGYEQRVFRRRARRRGRVCAPDGGWPSADVTGPGCFLYPYCMILFAARESLPKGDRASRRTCNTKQHKVVEILRHACTVRSEGRRRRPESCQTD